MKDDTLTAPAPTVCDDNCAIPIKNNKRILNLKTVNNSQTTNTIKRIPKTLSILDKKVLTTLSTSAYPIQSSISENLAANESLHPSSSKNDNVIINTEKKILKLNQPNSIERADYLFSYDGIYAFWYLTTQNSSYYRKQHHRTTFL